jgi:histidinol-phosphate/aromatic aminotransferase/cobyric acid decarboxylase-like protein
MGGYALPQWIRISIGVPGENSRCMAALKEVLNAQVMAKRAA